MGRYSASAVSLFLIAGIGMAAAEDVPPPDVEKVCAARACRAGGYEAVVFVDAERYTTIPVSHSPYILDDGSVLVFPGETIAVQFSPNGDTLGAPVAVKRYAPHLPALIVKEDGAQPEDNPDDATLPVIKENLPADEAAKLPPNSLLISYGQLKKIGDHGMELIVEQNLPQTIKLGAVVAELAPGGYKQHYTSTCPIMPKMSGNEMWPNALGPIVLGKFHFLAAGNSFSCE
ncbi:MAG TPA: hypothetical protein VMU22_10995 [Rhizomicrobium sp.]|nr:hypothetical protein [Rhizomicrobium sp.]